ncbi:MAG: toll/interleukin-1 receptor domain-containing protein, partial [Bacteroidales bacterium]|nr:toll/interleukin-1 receptor domain-containing protein [Bacteroidales bacterium]
TGIHGANFVGAIISPNSINSAWVKKELEIAMTHEKYLNKTKVIAIICEKCELPEFLQNRLNVDFTDSLKFQFAFEKLITAIIEKAPPVLFSAREALIELKGKTRGVGNLVGISQQGINQQYINLNNRGNWNSADAKTGRSRTWIAEYFNYNTLKYNSFGFCDGQITEYPILTVPKEHSQKIQVVNFVVIDSVDYKQSY